MKKQLTTWLMGMSSLLAFQQESQAQITLLQDYENDVSPAIGTFQGIDYRESGFSALYPIPGTNGTEFWTCTDRGVNIDAANANPAGCHPEYDKLYAFPAYAPKIIRLRLNASGALDVLQVLPMRRPNGTPATGIINPTGFGSTAAELPIKDTVQDCANFNLKVVAKDVYGIDSEGVIVDNDGNFWICEEGGPVVWKLNKNGVVLQRFTPYANQPGAEPIDIAIDSVFKYRRNNRGFEGIALSPNGKIYAIIQSPILYPDASTGENTQVHRILEIDPQTNATRMFAYLNDGEIGSGSNKIRLKDWKIGDMAAINDHEFLVLEAAARGTSDIKRMYKIDISAATPVHSGLYGGQTLEQLVDATGLSSNGITPVAKTLVMDLLANGWPADLDKAEGLAIINDSTIAIGNDNDYGQASPDEDGIAIATGKKSHVITFRLSGSDKLAGYVAPSTDLLADGQTGPSTFTTPYLQSSIAQGKFTSILTAGDVVGGYKMVGIPDGTGAFDNGDGTFTLLVNHEISKGGGAVRAHGSNGAFVSHWIINKSDLSVVSGGDQMQNVKLWNGSGYDAYNAGNPSALASFDRFCSADLAAPSAFYNSASGLGTENRIFINGEESGTEGRVMGHIATGSEAGTSYQLPYLGRAAWENVVASPYASDKTVVGGMDDGTSGQVHFYIGTKTNTGSDIEKAGLTNGNFYAVKVDGLLSETSASVPVPGTAFSLVNLGQVQNTSGTAINTLCDNAGVTHFLRPEDGAWDPSNPNDFYFVTTNSFSAPSRMWRLRFSDINNPELGGTIEAVLDGTEGQHMFDNMTIDKYGHALLQEDVGNNVHIGKVFQYDIDTDVLTEVGHHDPARFLNGGPLYLTQDEESSGVIDAQDILGGGMFLMVVQAHYNIPGEVYQGGQLLAFYNPDSEQDYYCAHAGLGVDAGANQAVYVGYSPEECADLTASISGGAAPYSVEWSTGETTPVINVCPVSGTQYSVTVTEARGCTASDDVTVCATDVTCGNNGNKVEVCATTTVHGQVVCHKTLCIAAPAVDALLAHSGNSNTTYSLGACDEAGECEDGGEAKTISGDFGQLSMTAEEANLIYGEGSFVLYPNPVANASAISLVVSDVLGSQADVTVTNVLGQVMLHESWTLNATVQRALNLGGNVPAGTYMVTVKTETSQITQKLVIK
ncbi:MAG: esterase-like activity of phytase family protein [Flavobacteriales bacterium]|nr:esterase-like activity of phytase family protein [Flavobacteriales bacterium]MCB9449009.1 esterase-like activity of phytase family protein [Flavobacteriales bacterium]